MAGGPDVGQESAQAAGQSATVGRLAGLRAAMRGHGLDAYLVPSVDEHINEYLPKNRERRAWLSGFTGSAGDLLVVCGNRQTAGGEQEANSQQISDGEAWLFVDSRYYEQADHEVNPAAIRVSKLGLEGQPTLSAKIKEFAEREGFGEGTAPIALKDFRLGFDPFTLTVQQHQAFSKTFEHLGIELAPITGNLVDTLWQDAPPPMLSEVFMLGDALTGKPFEQKIAEVRAKLKTLKADVLPLTKLDQVAWLFNLRGKDIPYNPVFTAYAVVTADEVHLFADAGRFQAGVADALAAGQVTIQPYEHYPATLAALCAEKTALIDPKHTTVGTLDIVKAASGRAKEAEHPVELLKAVKNETEIRRMQDANLKASRGKIRAWHWLDQQLAAGQTVTEASFRDAIESFYAQEEGFDGLSFNTISGAGENSSIVHYGTPSTEKRLERGELFLIDSGCQFPGGTTDDTRTLFVGTADDQPTDLQRLRFTEVLKAHINCAAQRFPKGTEGARLDGITRATLWQNSLDYGHGTGHGVGAGLNVHEGPNGISKLAAKALEPGMINSIEPGYYEPGWGGIRLENLVLVVPLEKDAAGLQWLGFESLTYIPFDPSLIDFTRLSPEQLAWLREYNAAIVEKIAPTLPPEEAAWLKTQCALPS